METKKRVGQNIRDRRIELGLTQEELAQKVGRKSKSTINKIEKGINDVNQSMLLKYAKALSTTPENLMGWKKVSDKVIETSQIGKAISKSNSLETALGKEILKQKTLDEIYDYCNGELPTFEELDTILALRRLSSYDKALIGMILKRDKEDGEQG